MLSLQSTDLRIRAWFVHFYTSLGLATGLFTLIAIFSNDALLFFIFQGISLFIDATDGYFARRWNVKKYAPEVDGRKLDDIIDYINYSFLPIAFAYKFGLVTGPWTSAMALILIASIYGFCQNTAKTNDGYFTGFPNFWNILVFYLFFFSLPVPVNAIVLLIFAGLIFVPIKYLSYSSPVLRKTTLTIGVLYGFSLLAILFNFHTIEMRLVVVSLFAPIYYFATSIYIHYSGRQRKTR